MAEPDVEEGSIIQGSLLPVTVEQVIADTLVVCLAHGAKMYRGVLLDATKSEMPFGLGFKKLDLEAARRLDESQCTAEVIPTQPDQGDTTPPNPAKVEVSALSFRHSYTLDPNSTDPKLLPPPRRTITKPLRDKNIRNMRLRPRQVLCSKCKQGVHETTVQGSTTSVSVSNPDNNLENPPKMDLRKRRLATEVPDMTVSKNRKQEAELDSKSVPIIKISFSQKGGGTVVKIPKTNLAAGDCQKVEDPMEIDVSNISHENYKKLKKALKRARLKEKMKAATTSNGPLAIDKKDKRNKHKEKRKHKHLMASNGKQTFASYSVSSAKKVLQNSKRKQSTGFASRNFAGKYGADGSSPNFAQQNGVKDIEMPNGNISQDRGHLSPSQCLNADDRDLESTQTSSSSGNGSWIKEACDDADFIEDSQDQSDTENNISSLLQSQDSGNMSPVRPLMMRIQSRNVPKCATKDGRTLCRGDVVWGKIHGFPWWPGKVLSITVSQRDNGVIITQTAHVSWFGSSTMSHMPCSELYPFLEDFKLRFNKKKKGPYKTAIKQATLAAHNVLNNQVNVKFDEDADEVLEVFED